MLAVVYTAFLNYAAGPKHLLLSCLLYAPAAAPRQGPPRAGTAGVHSPELALFGIILLGAVVAVELLITGTIRL